MSKMKIKTKYGIIFYLFGISIIYILTLTGITSMIIGLIILLKDKPNNKKRSE